MKLEDIISVTNKGEYKVFNFFGFKTKFKLRSKEIINKIDKLQAEYIYIYPKIEALYEQLINTRPNKFTNHYEYWRAKRITAIVEYYGEAWFKGKKILELGCGYGDIGYTLMTLGAKVVFCEGRKDNCDVLRRRFPQNRVYQVNLENEWPFGEDEKFDMILHLGLLYHLDNMHFSLEKCAKFTDILVLETQVCDSDDPTFVLKLDENSKAFDQSLIGHGSRPSAPYVENILSSLNFDFERVTDSRCNAGYHIYDWEVTNTKEEKAGLRRFWFCRKKI